MTRAVFGPTPKRQSTPALQNAVAVASLYYALAFWSAALLRRFQGNRVRFPSSATIGIERNVTTHSGKSWFLLFLLGERQKLFVRHFAVFHLIDSHFGHLHSLFGSFLGHIDIKLHNKGVASHKRAANFRAVHFHVVLPPIGFAPHLINATHFRRHVFHLTSLHAHNVVSVEIVESLPPFAFAAIVHQFCFYFFCTIHSSSLFLIKNCSTDICVTFAGHFVCCCEGS